MPKQMENSKIHLKNVRLSFPSLFRRAQFNPGEEGKYEATFLFSKKDKKLKAKIDKAIKTKIAESGIKVASDKRCLKDGDEVEYNGYEGMWSIKASQSRRPTVIDRDRTPIAEEDNVIYAGCYVNAIIDLWVQNNSFGKRVNANLYGVQFVKNGEAFGMGPVDVTDDFDDLSDDEEDIEEDDDLDEEDDDLDDD